MSRSSRLALGTAQFGRAYGIANRTGQVSLDEAARILEVARAAGLDTLDTAVGYGHSEIRLGEIGVAGWRIVSKLSEMPGHVDDVAGWVESSVAGSLERLGVDRLDGLLLHRPRQLTGDHGDTLRAALIAMRESGLARKVGISGYGPDDLDAVWTDGFDLVQVPFNVFDRRLVTSGWIDRLAASGVEIHTRSAFLQGLLLMEQRPSSFDRWAGIFNDWEDWLAHHSITAVRACLGFGLGHTQITRVVVGVDTVVQLQDILAAVDDPVPLPPDALASDDRELIDPSRWNLS